MTSKNSLWQVSEIKSSLEDQLILIKNIEIGVNQVVIDSRSKADRGLFIAIKGEFHDGHDFLQNAFENGCVLAIVDKIPEEFKGDDRLILVKNSLTALDMLAIFSRNRSEAKIIAVTGSAGKTSTKELLKKVFSSQGKTHGTIGNLNNDLGLPLSLCNMSKDVDFGIFEMGMSHAGELEKLSKIAKPHIAIITNVCAAHIGNFKNEEDVAKAKSEIFAGLSDNGFAILNADNAHYEFLKKQALTSKIPLSNIISFGSNEISDIKLISTCEAENFSSRATVLLSAKKQEISYLVNSINQTTIFNSLVAISCLDLIGKDISKGLPILQTLETPKGRGNLVQITKDGVKFTIIDDSYNANSESMKAGLKFLMNLKKHQKNSRAIAFVGDMLELGDFSEKQHREIVSYIAELGVDRVLLIGNEMKKLTNQVDQEKLIGSFGNSSEAVEKFKFTPQNGDIIFVKGSRGTRMEKLIDSII